MTRLRVATAADVDAMHRVRTCVRENQLTDPDSVRPEHYREMLNERGRGWVTEVEGSIVAFAVADRSRSNVWALFVDPAFEGRGIGRQLHDTMLDWLFAEGATVVWLTTTPGTRAETFYRAARWRRAGDSGGGEVRYEMSRESWAAARRLSPSVRA